MSYTADVYEAAEKEILNRRIKAETDLERRRDILYARSPRALEIERLIARTSVAAAKAIFRGEDPHPRLEALREENLTLQSELEEIIKSFGFPKNYLEPWYHCSECRDRGDIDGRMCNCMKTMLRQIAYDKLNSISPLSLCSFDSFSLDYYSKTPVAEGKPSAYTHMTAVLGFCKRYAKTFDLNSRSLLFQGSPGLGKTHLSLAIANELIQKGYGVIYTSAPVILSKLSKENFEFEYRSSDGNMTEQLLSECDLLILDDLGTEFTSRFSVAALYNILNSRTILSKPTIVSTNLMISELQEHYNFRIISRIIGTLDRLEFVGNDIRQLKRKFKNKNKT